MRDLYEDIKTSIFIVIILLISSTKTSFSQTNDLAGIKFNSKNVDRLQKTSIFLNEGKPIELKNSFSISFDISFWNSKYFGPIIRIDDQSGNEVRVVYNQHIDMDISYLDIIESPNNNEIQIPFFKRDLSRNQWHNIKLTFDKNEDSIKIYVDNEFKDKISYQLKDANLFDFVFGIKDWNNSQDFDVPGMCIKNILITGLNKRKYYWSLNPFSGNPAVDEISGSKLILKNPKWVYEDHKVWRKIADFKIQNTPMSAIGTAYDSTGSRLFIDGRYRLIIYDLITGKDSVIKYKTESPAFWNDLFYDGYNQKLYSYPWAIGKVSIYDLKKNEWFVPDTSKNDAGYYNGSAKFSYPQSNDLYLLGGYGWYKAKNDLFKYDFVKKEWQKVKLKKNEMTPRAFFTLGRGFKDGEYLIYGGFGNKTGDQDKGFNPYYNLFLLNMNDSTITKLKLPEGNKFHYTLLFNDLYLDKTDSSFYFLSQYEENKSFPVSLNRLDLRTGEVYTVGNKFWERSASKWIYSHLSYNKSTNELIAVIFDTTTVEIYAINFPPVTGKEKLYTEQIDSGIETYLKLFAAAVVVLIFLLIYIVRKNKTKIAPNSIEKTDYSNASGLEALALRNKIQLLGGFHIHDKEGKDIIYDFSPKLKEVLLLILLRSFNHNQHRGITSEELSSIIWPDSSPERAKSNRGVAINKIRKLLDPVEGVGLEITDKLWLIKINNESKYDYLEFLRFRDSAPNGNFEKEDSFSLLMSIVNGGEFLKGISYEWLDPIKLLINNEIILFLKQYFDNGEVKRDREKLLKLCDAILSFDSVDQNVIKVKIKTLSSTGKYHLAKSSYDLFVVEYKKLYDEQYPEPFDEIISSL